MSEHAQSPTSSRVLWGIGSARALRAHWALKELALDYRTEPIRTRTPDTERPEFVAVNPRRKIPALCDAGLVLTESAAIVTYLAERYGGRGSLYMPRDVAERARYYEWMSFICMELDATSLYVLRRHQYLPAIYGDSPVANEAARGYFNRMIDAAALALDPESPYLLGEYFSGVDIVMTTCLTWALGYELELPAVFEDYCARVTARSAHAEALEANRVP